MRLPATIRAALAAVAAALLVMLLPAQPAWAHARRLSTAPADGAGVTTPVTAVVLTFNEPIKQQFSTIVVTGADGVSHSQGSPRSVDATLAQTVGPLPPGPVRVAWRTVSSDGHPIEGAFTFTNAAPAGTSPAATTPPPAQAATPAARGGRSWIGWAAAASVVLIAGIGAGWWWRRKTAVARPPADQPGSPTGR